MEQSPFLEYNIFSATQISRLFLEPKFPYHIKESTTLLYPEPENPMSLHLTLFL
jgi:hypothetical protein